MKGRYERFCAMAAGLERSRMPSSSAAWYRMKSRGAESGRAQARDGRYRELSISLGQAGLSLKPETVIAAARATSLVVIIPLIPTVGLLVALSMVDFAVLVAFAGIFGATISREAIRSYPKSLASKRATAVLRTSTEGVNMMIMSLRHEPSLPKAMRFAARLPSEFGQELRTAIWSVVMGAHSTFEDSLQRLGAKWEGHSRELKSSTLSLITASCEGTEEGRRMALDRASSSLVSGARRRIEDYALGLSFPSMMLFSIGVLLPLMVGSFLPMLSWDMWAGAEGVGMTAPVGAPEGVILKTVLLMNIVFPFVALLIAIDASSRRPISSGGEISSSRSPTAIGFVPLGALACAILGVLVSHTMLDGTEQLVGLILSATTPPALLLVALGGKNIEPQGRGKGAHAEDALFSIGARMVEGENFESAVRRTMDHSDAVWYDYAASMSLGARIPDHTPGEAVRTDAPTGSDRSSYEAARVVMSAASKDEVQAGVLAMDLSRYIRDISDLELTLRRRLRPTVSMMRFTTHALAPVMLGVTYAIYLSLASIGGGSQLEPGVFFMVLGVFLAEINAVVAYFVWGIGEKRSRGVLEHSVGSCILVAELLYSATVLVVG